MIDSKGDGHSRSAWIRMIERSDATGRLSELYDRWHRPDGDVDNILKIHSLNPPSLDGHYQFYRTLMFGKSDLSRARREMIAVVVSVANSCHYWIIHHGAGLLRVTKDKALVEQITQDYRRAKISPQEVAMLDYSVKLTKDPSSMKETDVEKLHQAGFSDSAILDIAQITGYFNFVNRLADGLGVELEDYWHDNKTD